MNMFIILTIKRLFLYVFSKNEPLPAFTHDSMCPLGFSASYSMWRDKRLLKGGW